MLSRRGRAILARCLVWTFGVILWFVFFGFAYVDYWIILRRAFGF